MSVIPETELQSYCELVARQAKAAAAEVARMTGQQKNDWLRAAGRQLIDQQDRILAANQLDLEAAPGFGLTDAQVDRLRLSSDRIAGIAAALGEIAMLADPVGEIIESVVRPNGIRVSKVRVPLGVVFFVYESRPNVTADASAICVKSGNAVVLRGGKEAAHSSQSLVDIIVEAGKPFGLPEHAVQLVATRDREAVAHFLHLSDFIDVAIPRGGEGLIRRVTEEATMPVIKHFDGNCHVYIDRAANLEMATDITVNSKCHRMGVCNAAESLLINQEVADAFLQRLLPLFASHQVELRGDEATCRLAPTAKPATDDDHRAEFLGPIMSVKIVDSLDEAVRHINEYGSAHTDAIVTDDLHAATEFKGRVDSSAVMVNASTRFNDGGEFGLGAEIGISTDRFHARGPCGLRELTSYKYIVEGDGQTR